MASKLHAQNSTSNEPKAMDTANSLVSNDTNDTTVNENIAKVKNDNTEQTINVVEVDPNPNSATQRSELHETEYDEELVMKCLADNVTLD